MWDAKKMIMRNMLKNRSIMGYYSADNKGSGLIASRPKLGLHTIQSQFSFHLPSENIATFSLVNDSIPASFMMTGLIRSMVVTFREISRRWNTNKHMTGRPSKRARLITTQLPIASGCDAMLGMRTRWLIEMARVLSIATVVENRKVRKTK